MDLLHPFNNPVYVFAQVYAMLLREVHQLVQFLFFTHLAVAKNLPHPFFQFEESRIVHRPAQTGYADDIQVLVPHGN